jgi:peptidoglycan/LPS O-acetylase OafA/YrhL
VIGRLMNQEKMRYRSDIDGLRALAVLPVVFYHAGFGFPGGFVGVDVFFVISGYLITGILWRAYESGTFSLASFWERRIRRILPPLVLVLFASLIAGWLILLQEDFKLLGASTVAQSLFAANIHLWRESGYFQEPAELNPLLHTWSLAVEEQFYLLLPLLFLIRRLSKPVLIVLLAAVAALSLALSIYCSYRFPSANFYLLPTRAWELLCGSLLALSGQCLTRGRWMNEGAGWLGLVLMAGSMFLYENSMRFPGLAALPPCVGSLMVIWSGGHGSSTVAKLLSIRPLVFIGLISYPLYLWHWPLLVFGKWWAMQWSGLISEGELSAGFRWSLVAVSIILATLSWRFIERPIRQRCWLRTRLGVFVFGVASLLFLCAVGAVVWKGNGYPDRFSQEVRTFLEASLDRGSFQASNLSIDDAKEGRFVALGVDRGKKPADFLVWGDSHAKAMMPLLDQLAREHALSGDGAARSSLTPLVGYEGYFFSEAGELNEVILRSILKQDIRNVILIANWKNYMKKGGSPEMLDRALHRTVNSAEAAGARFWVMHSVPTYPHDIPRALAAATRFGKPLEIAAADYRGYQEELDVERRAFVAVDPSRVTLLDPSRWFRGTGDKTLVELDGKALYSDSNHITAACAMRLRNLFDPIFIEIKRDAGAEAR